MWKLGAYVAGDDALNDGQYSDWRTHHGASAQSLPGTTSTMYVIGEDLYYDVVWNSWTCCSGGGGFSYTRTLVAYPSCNALAAVLGCTNPSADNYDASASIDDGSCVISGCTDDSFCNYDPTANNDDGSCTNVCPGCIYEEAANFDPNATVDDGSCTIWDCVAPPYAVSFAKTSQFTGPQEDAVAASLTLARGTSQPLYNSVTETGYSFGVSPDGSLWKAGAYDAGDDALNDGQYVDMRTHGQNNFQNIAGTTSTMYVVAENLYYNIEWLAWGTSGSGGTFAYNRTLVAAPDCGQVLANTGCNDPDADNYDPAANVNDGSCQYFGCTDGNSCNYDPMANVEDGSCQQICLGCTAPEAVNYDPQANVDDGSCAAYDCYDGAPVKTFVKENNATGEDAIDQITPGVGITRGSNQGLFNSETETGYNFGISPEGTLWKLGLYDPADDPLNDGQYSDWRTHHGGQSANLPGQTSTLYLVNEDLYFTIEWLTWSQGNSGGGFSYTRTFIPHAACNEVPVTIGCTDPEAPNYDPTAEFDDGSCPVPGCTDFNACNYDPEANTDAGNCIFPGGDLAAVCTDDITVVQNVGEVGAEVCYEPPFITGGSCDQIIGGFGNPSNVLSAIESNYQDWLTDLGSTFTFAYDGGLNSISDGGNDMYDNGNILSLGTGINYTSGEILNNGGYDYFTAQLPGMFVFYASGDMPSSFSISGNNGADGSGTASGYSITGGSTNGYFKQVCDAFDPSINQLIITTQAGNTTQAFSSNTDDDQHSINGLQDEQGVLYILWAGVNGFCYSQEQVETLFNSVNQELGLGSAFFHLVSGLPSGSEFPVGTTPVSYVYDDGENVFNCDFTVTVEAYQGCTNEFASNYDPFAVVDDGSCEVPFDCQGRYEGPISTTFTKENNADWTLEENQDRITSTTWLTRQNNQGLFNIFDQTGYNGMVGGPSNTEWYLGTSDSPQPFTTWNAAAQANPAVYCNNGVDMTMRVTDADLYFDIEWN
ncbi:MAG: HYR domain-containing protein, partial [Flavobacteriales bacterium]|nr:HYR domain-containing protein [Flavobacteriales bacterium]